MAESKIQIPPSRDKVKEKKSHAGGLAVHGTSFKLSHIRVPGLKGHAVHTCVKEAQPFAHNILFFLHMRKYTKAYRKTAPWQPFHMNEYVCINHSRKNKGSD